MTNGVHVPTWQNSQIRQTYNVQEICGNPSAGKKLLDLIETRTGVRFDLDVLTVGFPRRAAAYKRSGLIFHRLDIIEPLRDRTIQLVFRQGPSPR